MPYFNFPRGVQKFYSTLNYGMHTSGIMEHVIQMADDVIFDILNTLQSTSRKEVGMKCKHVSTNYGGPIEL